MDFDDFDTVLTAAAAATPGVSYIAATNTLTFDGNVYAGTDFSFTINALADTLVEGAETFTATLSAPTNATLGAGFSDTVTITDDDAVVYTISASADPIAETGGATTFTIDFGGVSLAPGQVSSVVVTPSTTGTEGVDFDDFDAVLTAAAAATPGVSYAAATNTLTFDGNAYAGTDFSFTINALADTLVEGAETFTATLSAPTNATLGGAVADTVTITDDDAVVYTISASADPIAETGGATTFTIDFGGVSLAPGQVSSVVVTPSTTGTESVDFDNFDAVLTAAAAATPGVSYAAATNTLTFDGNVYAGTDFAFTINALADTLVEGAETFTATLSAPTNATLGGAVADTVTITDDDAIVFTIGANNDPIAETGGVTTFTIDFGGVSLGAGQSASVVVTPSGTAIDGTDHDAFDAVLTAAAAATPGVSYVAATNTLTFDGTAFGGSSFTFNINALGDTLVEGAETLTATLSAPTNATLGGAVADTVTITDDDAVVFTISASADPIVETGGSTTFTIDFGGVSLAPGQVSSVVVTPSGTGIEGVDFDDFDAVLTAAAAATPGVSYAAATNTLTFDGNAYAGTDFSFTINALGDTLVEGNETFTATPECADQRDPGGGVLRHGHHHRRRPGDLHHLGERGSDRGDRRRDHVHHRLRWREPRPGSGVERGGDAVGHRHRGRGLRQLRRGADGGGRGDPGRLLRRGDEYADLQRQYIRWLDLRLHHQRARRYPGRGCGDVHGDPQRAHQRDYRRRGRGYGDHHRRRRQSSSPSARARIRSRRRAARRRSPSTSVA